MLRASLGRVKASWFDRISPRATVAFLALTLGVAFSGCYWARYARLMETHLTLLVEFATKLEGLAADGETVPPAGWGEFTYPLERARDFARIAAQRYPGRPSLVAFERVLDVYAGLVATPEILDRPDAPVVIAARTSRLRSAVAETRAALAREST